MTVLAKANSNLLDWLELNPVEVAVVRTEKLVAEAGKVREPR
jgi:hypothetical protein